MIGRQLQLGIAKEAVRMTAETTAQTWFPVMENSLDNKNEFAMDQSSFGSMIKNFQGEIAMQSGEGEIKLVANPDTLGHFLFYHMGTPSTVTALGASTHTFTRQETDLLPTFTAFYRKGDGAWYRASGCTVTKIQVSVSQDNKYAEATISIVYAREQTATTQTPAYTYNEDRAFLGKHATIGYATTFAGLTSPTNLVEAKSFEIESMNDFDVKDGVYLGSIFPQNMYSKAYEVNPKFSALHNSAILDNDFKSGTKKAWQFRLENSGAQVLGTSSLFPQINFRFAPAQIEISFKKDLDAVTMFDASLNTEFSTVDSRINSIILQNTTTAY